MGSKSPEKENQRGGGDDPSVPTNPVSSGGEPQGAHLSRDGDGNLGDDNGDDDADGDRIPCASTLTLQPSEAAGKKKKRKRSKKKTLSLKQSSPPRIPLSELFPTCKYPNGETQNYGPVMENTTRTTADEVRYQARRHLQDDSFLNNYRKAAEVHRQVRQWTQENTRPGQTLTDIAAGIEDGVRALLDNAGREPGDSLRSGLGFPTGLALNNCVAHYTPNPGQKVIILKSSDVMKVDFGVHINGWIVDSAFTMSFDPMYDNLLAAVKDATNSGIKAAGIDVRISDISAAIQEAMESYEVEICGKTYPIKAVRNITGHDIKQYRIHGGKSIPFVKNSDQTRMEEGEIFAIETFGTTGRGYLTDGDGVYGYGKNPYAPQRVISPLKTTKSLYKTINENFGTLVFCRRYLERLGIGHYLAGVNNLVSNGILDVYPPLMDVKNSYSAQFEHKGYQFLYEDVYTLTEL
ncbi:Methionine aminopeptidase 2 [Myotisia sp. PD_48]|nr:Methionine aminopeptidase 2 [Myotisia sp. PD_48]